MRALFLVQGIASYNYIRRDLVSSGLDVRYRYSDIILLKTEHLLDKAGIISNTLIKLPIIGDHWDRFGDVFRYFLNKKTRLKVCKYVNEEINKFKETNPNHKIDIAAHSLGTIIAMTSGTESKPLKIDNLFLCGSPLGIKNNSLRNIVDSHIDKYSYGLDCNKLYYLANKLDYVAGETPSERAKRVFRDFSTKNYVIDMSVGKGHDFTNYVTDFFTRYKDFLN